MASPTARPLRISYPGAVYHVTARGNDRQAIVRDDTDRQRFVHTLAETAGQYHVLCHAWVLMDNHYHLVLEETPQANLSQVLRPLNAERCLTEPLHPTAALHRSW